MPAGQVRNAAVVRDTTGSTELGRCIVATVSGWSFGASDRTEPGSFVRTFTFKAGGGA
ncbi:MAG: hypothetical protein R2939_16050 [Kofleriaceae bacterium]